MILTPPVWWIENPHTGLLKGRVLLGSSFFIDVDYCQFSDWGYKKPTRLWCPLRCPRFPTWYVIHPLVPK